MSNPKTNPKSAHNQPTADPASHFKAIPWCSKMLSQKSIVHTAIPDRTSLASIESAMVRETFNTPQTVKACITYLKYIPSPSKQTMYQRGETSENPFLEFSALLDLGTGLNGYARTAHGGVFGVILDEIMGNAAALQSSSFAPPPSPKQTPPPNLKLTNGFLGGRGVENGAYTATLTVYFKRPLYTPNVVLATRRVDRIERKKIFLKGRVLDCEGLVFAERNGLWIRMEMDVGRWTTKEQKEQKEETEEKEEKEKEKEKEEEEKEARERLSKL